MHYASISGPDPEQVRRVASHLLALWSVGALDKHVDPAAYLEVFSVAWDDLKQAPRYVDFSLLQAGRQNGPVARLDVSRHLEIATRPEDMTPYDWLWAECLPALLGPRLAAAVKHEYQERDAFRKRSSRKTAKQEDVQGRLEL